MTSQAQVSDTMPAFPDMLVNPFESLLDYLPDYHKSPILSDGTIRCGETEFPIHKIIICAQSKFFLNAFTGEWKESSGNVLSLDGDEVSTVEAMLRFFYTFDYDASAATNGNTSPMVFNVKVYSVADKYDIPTLRVQAKEKFQKAVETCWDMDDFPYAIAEVYSSTPPNDKDLRSVVVAVACEHMQDLCAKKYSLTS
ncbi:BTB/POZ protein [Phaeosphaeria sp. MPI-PUGE-AT-0046c]|nr:BTB/POZ protein [Phaeosphaeria sp. MPI-PUGE-AT-0046c]